MSHNVRNSAGETVWNCTHLLGLISTFIKTKNIINKEVLYSKFKTEGIFLHNKEKERYWIQALKLRESRILFQLEAPYDFVKIKNRKYIFYSLLKAGEYKDFKMIMCIQAIKRRIGFRNISRIQWKRTFKQVKKLLR